jgi:hypothetical protein
MVPEVTDKVPPTARLLPGRKVKDLIVTADPISELVWDETVK